MRFIILLLVTAAAVHAAIAPEKLEKIRGLLREKKIAEAEAAANTLVAANPNEAEAHALLGSVRTAKGDGDAAVKACEKAVELAPTSSEYQLQLGDACGLAVQTAGMFSKMSLGKKCLAAYEKAVELDPANLTARSSLASMYQMAPAMMGGGIDKAYAQAAEIKKLDPTRGHIAYATLYTGEKKFTEAFAEFEEALKAAPDNYDALYQFGKLTALTGERVDRGMDALRKCLTLSPPPGSPGHEAAQWRIGNLWEKKGDKKAARAAYEAALAVNPSFQQAIDSLKKLD
jgi:tetratricopeptide (TPR) repeat protein